MTTFFAKSLLLITPLFLYATVAFGFDFKKEEEKLLGDIKHLIAHIDTSKHFLQFAHKIHQDLFSKKGSPFKIDLKKQKVKPFAPNKKFNLQYEVLGWYPYWQEDLYKSLNYSLISTMAYFSYEVNPSDGKPLTIHDWETTPLIDSVISNGNKVLLTVTNFGDTNNHEFLTNKKSISNLATELRSLLKKRNAHGICLDFEGVANRDRDAFTKFIEILHKELNRGDKKYLIYVAIPKVDWQKFIDFKTITPLVDEFIIMGYGYYGTSSKVAGPISPLYSGTIWDPYSLSTSVNYYLDQNIPTEKLMLGLPFYGSIWETESDKIVSEAKAFSGSRPYNYIKENIHTEVNYDSVSFSAWSYYPMNKEQTKFRQVWFEDSITFAMKLNYIKYKHLHGIGIWALGYDAGYHGFWRAISSELTNNKVPSDSSNLMTTFPDSLVTSVASGKDTTGFWRKMDQVEVLLEEVAGHKTLFLFIMSAVVLFGGAGLLIALFSPNTRLFFFSAASYKIYYTGITLLFLIAALRYWEIIDDLSISLIFGFIAGAVTFYVVNKSIDRINKNLP